MPAHSTAVTSNSVTVGAHTTHYLAAGPDKGPLVIFVHGWPELSISWRHQLPVFAGLGFRAIAPDMRGYGNSTVYPNLDDYAQELVVADMIALLDSLRRDRAIWVGHDWGSPTVWNIASHHPDRCQGVANLCLPYFTVDRGLEALVALINRDRYPKDEFAYGQWEYLMFYVENFEKATSLFDANPYRTAKALFRKADPAGLGQRARTSMTRKMGGFFGPLTEAPDVPVDTDVVTESDVRAYAESLERNGFFGPDAYYMNHEANGAYAALAVNGGRLDMPVLFLGAQYDYVCDTVTSRLAEPMREHCSRLDEAVVQSGHWMAQERPAEVNAALARWIATRLPDVWPST